MTNETLEQLLGEVATLPRESVTEFTPLILYHQADRHGPLSTRGYSMDGHLFVHLLDDAPTCDAYFWLNWKTGKWDIHFYTAKSHRRRGLATSLFRDGVLPWLQEEGGYDEICTTALSSESVALLKRLGFTECGPEFRFVVS